MPLMIGVDEAGRGPLAGPVTAAAVCLGGAVLPGLDDSKRLSEKRRLALRLQIEVGARATGLGWASPEEIDQFNILQATLQAMLRAVEECLQQLDDAEHTDVEIIVDGNQHPARHLGALLWPWPTRTLIGADALVAEVSAASILAKTARDAEMTRLDSIYPGYGFGQHAGYGTAAHCAALRTLGPSPVHRRSFRPVREAIRP